MNQRRFVVEIARPVPADDVASAAAYVARRLGMEEGRIRTLLNGRTGPVTRDVLADKADVIAKVFSEAGVMVTVVERPAEPGPVVDEQPQAASDQVPALDYEYGGPADPAAEGPPWALADAWHEAEADEAASGLAADPDGAAELFPPKEAPGEWGSGSAQGPVADEAALQRADGEDDAADEYRGAVDMRPSSTRWVPSPHGDDVDEPDSHGFDEDGGTDYDWSLEAAGVDEPDDNRDVEVEDVGFGSDFKEHDHGRLWMAPDDRSVFGELGNAPSERPQLRAYLLWALVVSLVLLIVLQLVFAARVSGATGTTYEAGLAPYRSGDFGSARRVWQSAAQNGDPRAQYMLGYLVQNGLGQPWSNRQAAEWYELAAAQGLPEAQTALAHLYLEGLGVLPDATVGVELLRRAAATGHAPALYRYAELLFHGRYVAQDLEAAMAAFEAAAAGGSAEARAYVDLARHLRDGATTAGQ